MLALINKKKANNIKEFDEIDAFAFEIEVLKINRFVKQIFREKENLIAQTIFDKAMFFYIYLIKINVNFKKKLFDVYIKFVK